ncbi:MAG: YfhO family protein [Actinomycetota bacterium]|nr:YfhO family protein [Actinomycetota bacterium]
MTGRRVDRATSWTLGVVVVTIILSIGLPLIGARTFLRSDTVLRWAPWNESQPIDLELTSIPVADPVDSWFPAQELFHRRLLDGDFAMWNPYPAGGTPLASVPHQGFFDPLNLPFLLFPDRVAPAWIKLAELSVAIAGVFLLLRSLGVSNAASLTSGFIYSFSGFQTVWTNWPQSHVGAYLPWLLWGTERLLRRRDLSSCLTVSLVTCAMLLAGFPALTGWAIALMLLWLILRSRTEFRAEGKTLGLVASAVGSVVLGVGLAAWQVLPFISQIKGTDLTHRAQTVSDHLSPSLMATAAIPRAFGSHAQGFFYGDRNYIETCAFLGAGALVIVVCALFWRPPASVSRSLTAVIAALLGVTTLLIYGGGPVLAFVQNFPVFDTNFVGRMRSIWLLLLALLVGLGLETLSSGSEFRGDRFDRYRGRWPVVGIFAVLIVTVAGVVHVLRLASREGHLSEVGQSVAIAGFAAAIIIGTVVLRRRGSLQVFLPVVVAAVAAAEILLFVSPFWPNEVPERHYPTTPAHEFLASEADGDRIAAHDLAFYSGTTTHYGIRTVTGHVFHQPTWRDLLVAVDPEAFDRSYTFSFLEFLDVNRLRSPVLDRMSVRWLVTQVDFPLPGTPFMLSDGGSARELDPDGRLEVTVDSRPLRGIELHLVEDFSTTDLAGRLRVEIVGPDGSVRTGRRHARGFLPAGSHWIPIAAEDLPPGGEMLIRVRLDADDGTLKLRSDESGALALNGMASAGGGLRLAYADDVAIWENLDALERVRFASEAVVVPDGRERVEMLKTPLPSQLALLSEQSGHLTSGAAEAVIDNFDDQFDHLSISLTTTGPGWLVVADAMQNGWVASVDGVPQPLVAADHAFVGVPVPEGSSTVTLEYRPSGLRAGVSISVLSLALVLSLAWRRNRRRGGNYGSGVDSSSMVL